MEGSLSVAANRFCFWLNDRPVEVDEIDPCTTLLNFLRDHRDLCGTKEGCDEGDCGACSVVLEAKDYRNEPVWRSVNSCLVLMPMLQGRRVYTVEGLAEQQEGAHPVQERFAACHGSQCGYCTPGFIMSLFAGSHREDMLEAWQRDDQLAGNLCRCTGYAPIRRAAEEVATHCRNLAPHPAVSKDSRLEFSDGQRRAYNPQNLQELFELRRQHPDAQLVAGGTDLSLEVTKRGARYQTLINLGEVVELLDHQNRDEGWRLGAGLALTTVQEILAGEVVAMEQMLRVFGSRPIRNRATLGGNLCTSSPIGDMAPVLIGLEAEAIIVGSTGERRIPLESFFTGYRQNVLQGDEILAALFLPRPNDRTMSRTYKVSRRRDLDISAVSLCASLELEEDQTVKRIRLVFGGVAATTIRATPVENWLQGKTWNHAHVEDASQQLEALFTPMSDHRGSELFRRRLCGNLLRQFWSDLVTDRDPYAPWDNPLTRQPVPPRAQVDGDSPSMVHDSGLKQCTGEARYVDDLPAARSALVVHPIQSPHARAKLLAIRSKRAQSLPGVWGVYTAADVPEINDVGPVERDEPLLADGEVNYRGQVVAVVVGDNIDICERAAALIEVDYEPLRPILTIDDAIANQNEMGTAHRMRQGDPEGALATATHRLKGRVETGGQEHFYLESQSALVVPEEDGRLTVYSSTQHPTEVQQLLARTLGGHWADYVVKVPRVGGGFGGKETQGAGFACLAGMAALRLGQPCKVWLNRDDDMVMTGKRHPCRTDYEVGFDDEGRITAFTADLWMDAGYARDLSGAVLDRAMFHLDNSCFIENLAFSGRLARTNKGSNTAFRGFGGPQGMVVIETALDDIAEYLKLDPAEVRAVNFYGGKPGRDRTPYGQTFEDDDNPLSELWHDLKASSDYGSRRQGIENFNAQSPIYKRGIAMQAVKFGISFTTSFLNQAGALVLVYADGSVQVNHGGVEMGQGLHAKIINVVVRELGVRRDQIRMMRTSTDKVPNTSATAASSGSDLNGFAVARACIRIRGMMAEVAERILGGPADQMVFRDGAVRSDNGESMPFRELANRCRLEQISLSSTGFYATPDIAYDRDAGRGRPFHYYACGAVVTEILVNTLTGQWQITRADLLHDVGNSLNPAMDRGQIEGAYIQGVGWLGMEELLWDQDGRLLTHGPSTYKIPALTDVPTDFRVRLRENSYRKTTIHGSRAVGEPPFMLGISVRGALRHALQSLAPEGHAPLKLAAPATVEAVLNLSTELRT